MKANLSRRRFAGTTLGGIAGAIAAGRSLGAQETERDAFGGWTSLRFEPSGFFRLEKSRGRWWFITPKGNAWLGLGLNHVHPGWLATDNNRAHWLREFGAQKPYDPNWRAGVKRKVAAEMKRLGFNHFGVHNDLRYVAELGYPFIKSIRFVPIHHYHVPAPEAFMDVFDDAFERHCHELARRECAPLKDNPWVLGYAMTDCPIFTDEEAAPRDACIYGAPRAGTPTWPRVLRNLGPDAPGKRAYVQTMRTLYSSWIEQFNETYGTSFSSFDDLLKARDWRPEADLGNGREMRDNRLFLRRVVERYYQVASDAIRRADPNHLFFGDKLNGNSNGCDTVVDITARYTDLVHYQMYGRLQEQRPAVNRWSKATGKPCFNGDGAFAVPNEMMPNPYGPHCVDQRHRVDMTREFARGMFSRPDFVGWSVCGWVDTWKTDPRKRFKQHSGFQDPLGRLHQPYVQALGELSSELYRIATSRGRR